jgi:hypothetical protein
MSEDSRSRIHQLCEKVIRVDAKSPEFEPTIVELRSAIREHLSQARDKVADLAMLIAAKSQSESTQ